MSKTRTATNYALILILFTAIQVHSTENEGVLYSFVGGSDGANPQAALVADAAGNLYGTTYAGGNSGCLSFGCGTVFELSPGPGGKWTEKVLYTFQGGTDGALPSSSLIFDSSGNLFGTTQAGGTGLCNYPGQGCGTVFELSPNQEGTWTETILHSFQDGADGAEPAVGLVMDSAGNLFGTTAYGGSGCTYDTPCGTVFELSPEVGGKWSESVIYAFTGGSDGGIPQSLVLDSAGNLYGTTTYSGFCYFCGVAFELSRPGEQWTYTTIYSFQWGGNGGFPEAGLLLGKDGNLYGTLSTGGNGEGLLGAGVVFELKHQGDMWQESMLYPFCSHNSCRDGSQPYSTLVSDSVGHFYGTTQTGGQTSCGVLFAVEPPYLGWRETVLHRFDSSPDDGCQPDAGVIFGPDGALYGTTYRGGAEGYGTVYGMKLPRPTARK